MRNRYFANSKLAILISLYTVENNIGIINKSCKQTKVKKTNDINIAMKIQSFKIYTLENHNVKN